MKDFCQHSLNCMTKLLHILLVLTIVSCGETQSHVQVSNKTDSSETSLAPIRAVTLRDTSSQETFEGPLEEGETQTCYVVVADTGRHYMELREQMFSYQNTLRQQIDTMERTYDKAKDLIALPHNHQDEIYAGDYLPRRYPSSTLSLEYLNLYQERASEKSIALVTGIYEHRESADSALTILKKINSKAFVVKSDIYMGCIH